MSSPARHGLVALQVLAFGGFVLLLAPAVDAPQSLRMHLVEALISQQLASSPVAGVTADLFCGTAGLFLLGLAIGIALSRSTLVCLLAVLLEFGLVALDFWVAETLGAPFLFAVLLACLGLLAIPREAARAAQ